MIEYVLAMLVVTIVVVVCLAGYDYLRKKSKSLKYVIAVTEQIREHTEAAERIAEAMAALDKIDAGPPSVGGVAMDGQFYRYYNLDELIRQ